MSREKRRCPLADPIQLKVMQNFSLIDSITKMLFTQIPVKPSGIFPPIDFPEESLILPFLTPQISIIGVGGFL